MHANLYWVAVGMSLYQVVWEIEVHIIDGIDEMPKTQVAYNVTTLSLRKLIAFFNACNYSICHRYEETIIIRTSQQMKGTLYIYIYIEAQILAW